MTSYRVEWDTNPPVLEVQSVRTMQSLGPTQIQRITTSAPDVDEVQSVHLRASLVNEVQVVKTSAALYETLGGSFALSFNAGPYGGGVAVTPFISHDAPAMSKCLPVWAPPHLC